MQGLENVKLLQPLFNQVRAKLHNFNSNFIAYLTFRNSLRFMRMK